MSICTISIFPHLCDIGGSFFWEFIVFPRRSVFYPDIWNPFSDVCSSGSIFGVYEYLSPFLEFINTLVQGPFPDVRGSAPYECVSVLILFTFTKNFISVYVWDIYCQARKLWISSKEVYGQIKLQFQPILYKLFSHHDIFLRRNIINCELTISMVDWSWIWNRVTCTHLTFVNSYLSDVTSP